MTGLRIRTTSYELVTAVVGNLVINKICRQHCFCNLEKEMSYRMLRKRQNPSPNWADKLMFEVYARFGLFVPFTAFVSLLVSDSVTMT